MNHMNIALIPKIENPSSPQNFRPISLTNIIYKTITKILANCLKRTLPSIISSLQTAFVLGRNIKENSIITHEMFHYLKISPRKKGQVALKLNMEKAFGYTEWNFLFIIMRALGYSSTWINLIRECITMATSPSLSMASQEVFSKFREVSSKVTPSLIFFLFYAQRCS